MNVPSERGEIHDKHHLGEGDFDLCDWDAIDEVDDVAGISNVWAHVWAHVGAHAETWRREGQGPNTYL